MHQNEHGNGIGNEHQQDVPAIIVHAPMRAQINVNANNAELDEALAYVNRLQTVNEDLKQRNAALENQMMAMADQMKAMADQMKAMADQMKDMKEELDTFKNPNL